MEVAIIGAGLAGLACAHELESSGIRPVIYERNGFIGEQHTHVAAILEIIHRPIKDCINFYKEKLDLDIKPLNTVNTIVHYSPNKMTTIKGDFGYFFVRDKSKEDLKNQLFSQLHNTEVRFNEIGDYEKLSKAYDYVVIANGTPNYTRELGCWKEWLNTYVRGGLIEGDFDLNTLIVWINKDYCKNGYAYLCPLSRKRAAMALVVTEISEHEVDLFWEKFLYTENIKYTILEEFKLNHNSGHVYPHKIGNIYFAGNAGGVIDPFLGFGQMSALITGVAAARSIATGKDYEKLIATVVKNNIRMHEFRKMFDMANNNFYDLLFSSISVPGLKHLIYHTGFNVVKYGSMVMKLVPKKEK